MYTFRERTFSEHVKSIDCLTFELRPLLLLFHPFLVQHSQPQAKVSSNSCVSAAFTQRISKFVDLTLSGRQIYPDRSYILLFVILRYPLDSSLIDYPPPPKRRYVLKTLLFLTQRAQSLGFQFILGQEKVGTKAHKAS